MNCCGAERRSIELRMVITAHSQSDRHVLKLQGRFDANWADLVAKTIETAIRAGNHDIDLDFGEVSYISSAGIRVLLKYSRQLKSARGTLRVVRATEAVLAVIRLSGLAEILLSLPTKSDAAISEDRSAPDAVPAGPRRWQCEGVE